MPIRSGSFKSGGYVQSLAVSTRPCSVISVQGYHKGGSNQFLQLHQVGTVGALATGTIFHVFAIGLTNNFNVNIPVTGLPMDALTIALSSTADTYTAGAADIIFTGTIQPL